MKKIVKITELLRILVLYCFILSLYSSGISASGIFYKYDQASKVESYFQVAGVDLFNQTTKPENVVSNTGNHFSFSLKNHLTDFWTNRKVAEFFLLNTSSKYIFYASNTLERFQQTDIIFPFHYFW